MVLPGIALIDKPGGMTSHDVVARARRALGTRKIGHAGTLDPMATGLLILGVEGATRLLTYIVGEGKTYQATIRLGERSSTDDADGDVVPVSSAMTLTAEQIESAMAPLRGEISQVPSAVSAIKVDGRRAYDRVRAGEDVQLAARAVTVSRFDVCARRESGACIDLDVVVDCSSGTYIRALARDLGEALGVGGHLTALRRTHIGPYSVDAALESDALSEAALISPADAAATLLPSFATDADTARDLRHGKRVPPPGDFDGPHAAAIDPDGRLIGIVEKRGSTVKSVMNMPEASA